MKKTDRRVIRTQKSIRDAFLKLMQMKEFHQITVTELAHLADIDRKTFYLHYNSTADILNEFETELAEKVLALLQKDSQFDIHTFFSGLNNIMMEDIGLYRRISEATSYGFFLTECKDILKRTIQQSFYASASMTPEIFNVYTEYIASGIIGIYTDWLCSNSKISMEELTEAAKDAVSNGWNKIVK